MGSPHYIGTKRDKSIYYVYCHNGSKLHYNGRTLYDHYRTTEQVEELLEHGGMSYLAKEPEEGQYYKFWEGRTKEYGSHSVDAYGRAYNADGGTPCYLWNGTEWLYSPEDGPTWIRLSGVFANPVDLEE